MLRGIAKIDLEVSENRYVRYFEKNGFVHTYGGWMSGEVEVSVIIPSLNEERTIGVCIEKVKRVFEEEGIKGEIIVADNSTDKTPEIARSLGAKVVTPDKRGYGYAYLYAFKHARGKYIVIGDADDTYNFLEIPKLLEPLKNGEADLVIGSRFKGEILDGAMSWLHKHIGNPVLTWFLNFFFKAGVSDAHSGFRAFTREALDKMKLKGDGMEFASEMIMRAVWAGLRIKEVPITYYPRKGSEPKLKSFRDGWRHLKFMLLYAPSYLFVLPGIFLFILGMALVFLISAGLSKFGHINLGIHSMIASSLLAILGYQLLFLGLAGKIYRAKMDMPNDRIVEFLTNRLSLEKGATIGLLIFLAGFVYTAYLIWKWVERFRSLPMLNQDVLAFTLIVIGLQTVFHSFFLSMLGEKV